MADISVRKRGEKWYYSFEAATVDGKRNRIERVGGKTKKEALEKGIQALNEYNNSGQHYEPKSVSVADFLDYYLDNDCLINNKYNTIMNHQRNIENYLKPKFGAYRLSSLSVATIQEFINQCFVDGLAKSTIENIISPLSKAYEFAMQLDYVKSNPCDNIKYPQKLKRSVANRTVIPIAKYNEIINALKTYAVPYTIAIKIGWYTGLRISETYGLTWDCIDFERSTITVNKQIVKRNNDVDLRKLKDKKKEDKSAWYFQDPKTLTSTRTINVSSELMKELNAYRKEQLKNQLEYGEYYKELYLKPVKDEKNHTIFRIVEVEKTIPCTLEKANLVFRKENGEYSSTDSFKFASRIIHHRLGYQEFNYHSLRHTHATMLIDAGVSPKTVQLRLGHASIQTTYDRYVHETDSMRQAAVDLFDKAMTKEA